MSTEYYTEPRLTTRQIRDNVPPGLVLQEKDKPVFARTNPDGSHTYVDQFMLVHEGQYLQVFSEMRLPKRFPGGNFVPDTARFERFGRNKVEPMLAAIETHYKVKVFDETGCRYGWGNPLPGNDLYFVEDDLREYP